ncbi:MAG: sterol desaturase family protein [Xanthobacteraceae bacterium]|nr:sterol desaturase family protein [Xanthobacteraceae bacterium]
MSDAGEIAGFLLAPFGSLVAPQGSLYWLYLASATIIAVMVYWSPDRAPRPSLRGALAFLFPGQVYRHPSAKLDFKFFLLNTLLYGAFVAPLLLSSLSMARATLGLLVDLFGVPDEPMLEGLAAQIAATAAVVIAADFGFYVSHYLQHKVPLLWEFHKVHHSAEVLHPITAFRAHPVDQVLDAVLMGGMTGLVLGLAAYGFGTSTGLVTVIGMNAFVFVFNIAGSHLRHSHVWLSYGPRLEGLFVSPALNQIHHSLAERHRDKNLGGMLSVWDRLMGTLYVPRGREELTFGLAADEHRDYTSVTRLYALPFANIMRRCLRILRRDRAHR